ncbi:MAG: hypothetical protein JXA92_06770 [candidate division Zixibacteria bacterium]|nr:hypothetical protein [candidate division Zixibacteria bacterium]
MKVNPVGINTYQNLTGQEKTGQKPVDAATLQQQQAAVATTEAQTSKLAVKAPSGSYAEMLSVEEKQALEVLFSRFKDSERFGAVYQAKAESAAKENTLGRIIDIKV